MPSTITEYGVRRPHPVTGADRIQWPATTGYLALPGGTVNGTDLEGLREALAREPKLGGASIVVRSYEIDEVAPPEPALPTTPGSVIRAGLEGRDDFGRLLFMRHGGRLDLGTWLSWHPYTDEADSWSGDPTFTDVEILFDAGSAP